MCGVAGFIDFNGKSTKENLNIMVAQLRHRGPDDYGIEILKKDNQIIGLGQCRLSIIDISSAGHQPMHFKNLSIIYNGEIYNYKEIRKELIAKGHTFVSNSDTEVILQAFYEWGESAVHKFIGMFVFCIYDKKKDQLVITRDRAGVKPLYYYYKDGLFLFGSELKALMAHPTFEKDIENASLPLYLQYGYIPAPLSIFKNCNKLLPGHHLKLDLQSRKINLVKYWNVLDYYRKEKLNINYSDAKEELHALLISACSYRMVADVPVGVFLSGGYDSTAVTAILQSLQTEKLKTFTIGFEEGNNEAPFAKEIAKLLGTDHTELICTKKRAQEIISNLSYFYDEPFGDSSAIPTTLVSQLAKKQVTVALSADAGDEIFCGYQSYFNLYNNLKKNNSIPKCLKPIIRSVGQKTVQHFPNFSISNKHKLQSFFLALNQNKLLQAKDLFQLANEKPYSYISSFLKKNQLSASPFQIDIEGFKNEIEIAMGIDYQSYLQNDILTKVDRATMSVSLEGREPLLDHRIIEYAAQLPFEYKYKDNSGKRILKDIVHGYVPSKIMDRPKTGFSLPINQWLRTDLSFLIDEYLNKEALQWSGLLNEGFIVKEVKKFNNNKMHYSPVIWYLLMFQMWYKRWMK